MIYQSTDHDCDVSILFFFGACVFFLNTLKKRSRDLSVFTTKV